MKAFSKNNIILITLTVIFLTACGSNKKIENSALQTIEKKITKPVENFKVVGSTGNESLFDDFSAYGVGKTAPFGIWKAKGSSSHIEESIQPDGKTGNILTVTNGGDYIYTDTQWTNYIFEVNWKDGEPALFFRLSEDGNKGYIITKPLGYNTSFILYKFVNTARQKVAESGGYDNKGGQWMYIRTEVNGGNIKLFVNGEKLLDINDFDNALASGGVGLGSSYGTVHYDNVRVEEIK